MCVAEELEKSIRAFLAMHGKQQSAEGNGAADGRVQSDSEGEDGDEERGHQKPMLQHLRRLSEGLLKGQAAAAMHLIPLEQHLHLLKALGTYLLQGRDKVVYPDEEVSSATLCAFPCNLLFSHALDGL